MASSASAPTPCESEERLWCPAGHVTGRDCYNATACWNANPANCTGPVAALCGVLPDDPAFCNAVQTNNIYVTDIAGSLPQCIGSMHSTLTKLLLSSRTLTGTIPASVSSLTELKKLDLAFTSLSGTLPRSFGSLRQMIHFDGSDTDLSGSIPASFGSLSSLEYLKLSAAGISGKLPASFASLSDIELIDFTFTHITDIPAAWCRNTSVLFTKTLLCSMPTDPTTAATLNSNLCTVHAGQSYGEEYACAAQMAAQGCLSVEPPCLTATSTTTTGPDQLSTGGSIGIALGVAVVVAAIVAVALFKSGRRLFVTKRVTTSGSEMLLSERDHVVGGVAGDDAPSDFQAFIRRVQTGESIWLPDDALEIVEDDIAAIRAHSESINPAGSDQRRKSLSVSHRQAIRDKPIRQRVIGAGSSGRIVLAKVVMERLQGHMGEDFRKPRRAVFVALKQHYELMGSAAEANFAAQEHTDFESEVAILRRLRHPNVVSFIGLYRGHPGQHTKKTKAVNARSSVRDVYIVMEFADNGTVADHLEQPLAEVSMQMRSRWMIQTARAMDYLHQNKIVHRDLKPSNVLLNARMECLITDFGISSFPGTASGSQAAVLRAVGTVEFMPPEAFGLSPSAKGLDDDSEAGTASAAHAAEWPQKMTDSAAVADPDEVEQQRRAALLRRVQQTQDRLQHAEQGQDAASCASDEPRSRDGSGTCAKSLRIGDAEDTHVQQLMHRASPGRRHNRNSKGHDAADHGDEDLVYGWDVFSFAIFVACIFNRVMPYSDVADSSQLPQLVVDGLRPPVPSVLASSFRELLQRMWQADPGQRPNFARVVAFFVDEAAASVASVGSGMNDEHVV